MVRTYQDYQAMIIYLKPTLQPRCGGKVIPLTVDKKRRIIGLYAQGKSYDEIVGIVGVGKGSITSVIRDARLAKPDIDSLREQARALKGKSVLEATRDASFRRRLDELGVGSERLPGAVALLEKYGEKADDVLQKGLRLAELAAVYGKNYPDIVDEYDERASRIEEMKNREQSLTKTLRNLEKLRDLQQIIRAAGLTEDDVPPLLKAFAEELKKLGSSPEEAASILAKALLNYRNAEGARIAASAELERVREELRSAKTELDGMKTRLAQLKRQAVQTTKAAKEIERIHDKREMNLEADLAEKLRLKESDYQKQEIAIKKDFDNRVAERRKEYELELATMFDSVRKASLQVESLRVDKVNLLAKIRELDEQAKELDGVLAQADKRMEEAESRLKADGELAALAKLTRSPKEGQPKQSALEAALSILAILWVYLRDHSETLSPSSNTEMEEQLKSWYKILSEGRRVAG